MRRVVVGLVVTLVILAFASPQATQADEPNWYERYLVGAMCAQQGGCSDLPSGWQPLLDQIYRPIRRASAIPSDEPVYFLLSHAAAPNAFSFRHYTGITAGLTYIHFTRDEWAFVAAHELSHIELGHFQAKQDQIGTIYTIAGISMLFSHGTYNPLNDPFFVLVAKIALASYSRDQETAADLRGVQIMRSAGFDPHAAISALLKLDPAGEENTGDLFADHPSTTERIDRIRTEIGE